MWQSWSISLLYVILLTEIIFIILSWVIKSSWFLKSHFEIYNTLIYYWLQFLHIALSQNWTKKQILIYKSPKDTKCLPLSIAQIHSAEPVSTKITPYDIANIFLMLYDLVLAYCHFHQSWHNFWNQTITQ